MRDVNNGWLIRYLHSNTASAFFFLVYLHIGRGIYYGSYRSPRTLVWAIGTVILIAMMATEENTYMWPSLLLVCQNLLGSEYSITFQCSAAATNILPFNKSRTRAIKRIGPHNIHAISIIICGLLGDWWGNKIPAAQMDSVRFNLEQSVKNSAYIHHINLQLYELGYCSTETPKLVVKSEALKDKRLDPTELRHNYRLTTFTYTSLLWIFNDFYKEVNGVMVKRVPSWVGEFITPLGLANWIMQDGSRQKKQGVTLATNSFTYEECVFLSKILTDKFNLKTSVIKAGHEGQWKISIWKQSMPDLVLLVKPYIIDEMKYKFEGYI
jgi:ubiquinol-cytochrome c reductase cytochrome b subunit